MGPLRKALGSGQQRVMQAATEAGRAMPRLVVAGGQIDQGYAAAMHIQDTFVPRPTAVFATNDRAAVG